MLDLPIFGVMGRVHPMVLHVPIGVLVALAVVELVALVRRRPLGREVRVTLAWLAALAAVMSALSGLQLSRESAYTHDGVFWHQWLGIGVGVMAVVCAGLATVGAVKVYLGALVVCIGLVIPAGHNGAGITHGDDFLFEPLHPKPPAPVRGNPGEKPARADATAGTAGDRRGGSIAGLDPAIGAIFQQNCIGCHNSTKLKGGLALDTAEGLQNGGEGGAVVVVGKPSSSEIMIRLLLTPGDKEHMPPPGRKALSVEEVEVIRKWIESGGEGVPKGP